MVRIEKIRAALIEWWGTEFDSESKFGELVEIPGGFLSRAFKISRRLGADEKMLFLRTCKSRTGGYTFSFDRLGTFGISHDMYRRSDGPVGSYGVFAMDGNGEIAKDLFSEENEYFHVQDFKLGEPFVPILSAFKNVPSLNGAQMLHMQRIGRALAELHNAPMGREVDGRNAVLRSQREIMINPQLTLDVLSCYPSNHPILGMDNGKKYDYLVRMHRITDALLGMKDVPCTPLHGDFWAANILMDENGTPFFIDYSRIPFGDPAIDVGTFLGTLIFDGLLYDSPVYFEAAEAFFGAYANARNQNDAEILSRSLLPLLWIGIIRMYPPVFGDSPKEKLDVFASYLEKCYSEGRLLLEPSFSCA